jgi:ribonucleoside-diphosphate reductase beta chain
MLCDDTPMPAVRQQLTLLDPQALYEQWERQHWAAHEIDLGRDREDWLAMPLGLRERLLWHIAAFFVGEERVTFELGPLLAAADTPSEAAFVATQLADEARHAQHFDRFYEHVAGRGGGFADRLAAARSDIGAPLAALLDDRLSEAARRLAAAPRDRVAKLDFVVLYHMIIEGTIAVAGQHVLLDFLDRRALLPGWREGLRHIVRDEHRHVAYGAWVLREMAAADPAARRRIADRLAELEPLAAEVLLPRGARGRYFRPLGWTGEQLQELALGSLHRRLRATGVAFEAGSAH